MREGICYTKLKSGLVECRVCNQNCKIEDGKVGICGVRKNIGGKLGSLVYGLTTGLAVDPIEKKPLYHFLPSTRTLSFGTLGCNFRCSNCQNFYYSQMFEKKGKVSEYKSFEWGGKTMPLDIVKTAQKFDCPSISYTYNEPTVFVEYALDTMKLAKKRGIKNVWISNGFMSEEVLEMIIPYLDVINIDIKSFDEDFYQKNCGASLRPVLENCKNLVKNKIWLEVTTLVIPSLSDDLLMLKKIALFIKEELGENVPWHVSAFSGAISWKLKDLDDTKESKISKICKMGKDLGLKYVYGGNVIDDKLNNTYCPKCGKIVFERKGYVVESKMKKGRCKCGEKILGVWK